MTSTDRATRRDCTDDDVPARAPRDTLVEGLPSAGAGATVIRRRRFRASQRMGARERIRAAIDAPTAEAAKLLNELQDGADDGEKLTILINGWCRGLAAALEELAASIDMIERRHDEGEAHSSPQALEDHDRGDAAPAVDSSAADNEQMPTATDADVTEDELAQRAAASRAKTATLRNETVPDDEAPREDVDESVK